MNLKESKSVLIVDDNPAIHDDYKKILDPNNWQDETDERDAILFGTDEPSSDTTTSFDLSPIRFRSAFQGQESLETVRESMIARAPFDLAIVDMQMPPGWDGVETVINLWKVDPCLPVIFCTAFNDYTWEQMVRKLKRMDRYAILKKPFEAIEVQQLVWLMFSQRALAS